jgi:hypothetical protein
MKKARSQRKWYLLRKKKIVSASSALSNPSPRNENNVRCEATHASVRPVKADKKQERTGKKRPTPPVNAPSKTSRGIEVIICIPVKKKVK